MFPIKQWKTANHGYDFGDNTFYTAHHLGVDHMVPKGTPLYAPFDGEALQTPFPDGGNVVQFTANVRGRKHIFRFMHLDKYGQSGYVKAGEIIGYTGNTGNSTGPHLHTDISLDMIKLPFPGNFIDPMTFDWGDTNNEEHMSYDLLQRAGDATVYYRIGPVIGSDSILIPISSEAEAVNNHGKAWSSRVNKNVGGAPLDANGRLKSFDGQGVTIADLFNQNADKAAQAAREAMAVEIKSRDTKIESQKNELMSLKAAVESNKRDQDAMTETVSTLQTRVNAVLAESARIAEQSAEKDKEIASLQFRLKDTATGVLNTQDLTVGQLVSALWDKIKNKK